MEFFGDHASRINKKQKRVALLEQLKHRDPPS